MATMRPELSEERLNQLESSAEAIFYRACRDQLPDAVLVMHSTSWTYRDSKGKLREGEADFTVALPAGGLLAVEVKGGRISFDARTGCWTSTNKHGVTNEIKNPFRQAQSEKYALRDQVMGNPKWRAWPGERVILGHCVMFPNLDNVLALSSPERPAQIIGGRTELDNLPTWLSKVSQYFTTDDTQPLGSKGVQLVEDILCTSIDVRPLLRSVLDDAERDRIRLTERQAKILRTIGGRKRAVIAGGAGTGKTLIAVEKARQLAAEGARVLLLCYNRPLADVLALSLVDTPKIEVMGFHQLCDRRRQLAYELTKRDIYAEAEQAYPGNDNKNKFECQMPFALALSGEVLKDDIYDAVIVDEAQDFSDEYWFSIEDLLKDPKQSVLYLFYDPNQALYKRHANLPVAEDPFFLTANCRNTAPVHEKAYVYYKGEPVDSPELVGPDIVIDVADSDEDQARLIFEQCQRLLRDEKVSSEDIVVLLAKGPKLNLFERLRRWTLPNGVGWSLENRKSHSVFVDTVSRFKGLEAPIVIIWIGAESLTLENRETLYVGMSRAKHLLHIVGGDDVSAFLSSPPAV
jgi:hypothetical protein